MTTTVEPKTKAKTHQAIVKRECFAEGLSVASRAIGPRSFKPVLACARIDITDDKIKISGTNLEQVAIYTSAQIQMESGPFVVATNCASALQIISQLDDDTIKISVEDSFFVIRSSRGIFKLPTLPHDEMPPMEVGDAKKDHTSIAVSAVSMLYNAVKNSSKKKEPTRYCPCGILVLSTRDSLSFVATDGRRCALATSPAKGVDISAITPMIAIDLILSMAHDENDMVEIRASENQLVLSRENLTILTNTVEGTFPDYQDLFNSTSQPTTVTIGRESLASIIRQIIPFADDGSGGCKGIFTFDESGLGASSQNNCGETKLREPCKVAGPKITVGINAEYFLGAVQSAIADEVEISLGSPRTSLMVKVGPSVRHIIMPVNI